MKVREAITIAAHVAAKNAEIPALAHVRIADRRIYANDLTQQVEIPVELPKGIAQADVCVNAHRLVRVLKALPEEREVELEVKGKRFHVTAGPTRYELATLPAEDFPALAEDGTDTRVELVAPCEDLAKALKFAAPAMAVDDIRYYLCGLHVATAPGRIVLTSTDGHRLHRVTVKVDAPDLKKAEAIIPAASVARIIELAGRHKDIDLALSGARLTISQDESLSTKLIDGKFPEADRVIPKDRPATGTVDRKALAEAIRRVAQIHLKPGGGIRTEFAKDRIVLTAENVEQECATETFEWSAAAGFTGCSVGFQWLFLVEALAAFDTDRVHLHLGANDSEALYITDGDDGTRQVVIMPMRI